MELLSEYGFKAVNHYTPLHYLPFIARSGLLRSKPELRADGFVETHFRSKSKDLDESRGFGGYVHLTTHDRPPILRAKLAGGFPHIRLQIPTDALQVDSFDLCRFNVAMTRQLRRGSKTGHTESHANGRYYNGLQIPIARTNEEKRAMLDRARRSGVMLEVLVPGRVLLPEATEVHCYSASDVEETLRALRTVGRTWTVYQDVDGYQPDQTHATHVRAFLEMSLGDPCWKGNGLEFDRI